MPDNHAFVEYWKDIKDVLTKHMQTHRLRYSEHAKTRMKERGIPESVVQSLLMSGYPIEMFKPFSYPYGETPNSNKNPVFTIAGIAGEKRVAIGLAIEAKHGHIRFNVLTVKTVSMNNHRFQ